MEHTKKERWPEAAFYRFIIRFVLWGFLALGSPSTSDQITPLTTSLPDRAEKGSASFFRLCLLGAAAGASAFSNRRFAFSRSRRSRSRCCSYSACALLVSVVFSSRYTWRSARGVCSVGRSSSFIISSNCLLRSPNAPPPPCLSLPDVSDEGWRAGSVPGRERPPPSFFCCALLIALKIVIAMKMRMNINSKSKVLSPLFTSYHHRSISWWGSLIFSSSSFVDFPMFFLISVSASTFCKL